MMTKKTTPNKEKLAAMQMTDRNLGEVIEHVAKKYDTLHFLCMSDKEISEVLHEAARRLQMQKIYPDNYNFD